MKTVLITGCSSGFGLETAKLFLARGWRVIATMRTPRGGLFPSSDMLRILPLDIANPASIAAMISEVDQVDALVNNAGIGMMGVLEGNSRSAIEAVFDTNVVGTIAMTKAILPQLRAKRSGVIVNVTSATTLKPLPMLSVYTASKAAIEAFTDCLALELKPLGIRVATVLPGRSPETRFRSNAQSHMGSTPDAYVDFFNRTMAAMGESTLHTTAADVANAVWLAVTDDSAPAHIPAGADAIAIKS